jgi:hypothetical protein
VWASLWDAVQHREKSILEIMLLTRCRVGGWKSTKAWTNKRDILSRNLALAA